MAKKTEIGKILDKLGLLTPEELKVLYNETNPGEKVSVYEADSKSGTIVKQNNLTTVEIKKLKWFLSQITSDATGRVYFKNIPMSISKEVYGKMVVNEFTNIK